MEARALFPERGEDMHAAVARECKAVRTVGRHLRRLDARQDRGRRPRRRRVPEPHVHQLVEQARAGPLRYGVMLREDGFVMDDGVVGAPRARSLSRDDHDRRRGARAAHDGGLSPDRMAGPRGLAHLDHGAMGGHRRAGAEGPRGDRAAGRGHRHLARSDAAHERARGPHLRRAEPAVPRFASRANSATRSTCRRTTAARSGRRCSSAARPIGITPYGTETMHVLRAEKGYIIVGQETDGTVTPDDVGLAWA